MQKYQYGINKERERALELNYEQRRKKLQIEAITDMELLAEIEGSQRTRTAQVVYDKFVADFIAANVRATEVKTEGQFAGKKLNSLEQALKRGIKNNNAPHLRTTIYRPENGNEDGSDDRLFILNPNGETAKA